MRAGIGALVVLTGGDVAAGGGEAGAGVGAPS